MKALHLILGLAVLMIVVFVITFFKMYLDSPRKQPAKVVTNIKDGGPGVNDDGATAQLEFVRTRYPNETAANELPLQSEAGRQGWYDFWFHNPTDNEVRLGLKLKNCTCTDVGLHLLKGDWVNKLLPLSLLPLSADSPLTGLTAAVVSRQRGQEWVDKLQDGGVKLDDTIGATVAGRQCGFIRMTWSGEKKGGPFFTQTLSSSIWYANKDSGYKTDFQLVGGWLVEPVMFDAREKDAGALTPDEAPREVTFRCWTSTRKNLRFECDTRKNPHLSWEVKPFTTGDEGAVRRLADSMPMLREGHTIRIKVSPRTPDGKSPDLGPFNHKIDLTIYADGEQIGSDLLVVSGRIKGDVRVIAPNQEATELLLLGSFPVSKGKSVTATIEVERPEVEVEVESVPPYIEATREKQSGMGKTGYLLHVKVLPNKIAGKLPRQEGPNESVIVLKIKSPGEPTRRVRVPVIGEATQ